MECHSISADELPGTSRLYSTFLSDFSRVREFYLHPPSANGIDQAIRDIRFDDSIRRAVVEILSEQNRAFGGDDATARNLERLRDGAFAVVTGQQVGLFGGPAFSVYKALTAVHVARELSERGINAVPVFWLATEDHDLAEVDHCYFPKRGGFERLELRPSGLSDRRVGDIPLGEGVVELAAQAGALLEGPCAAEVGQALLQSYAPDETFGSAFGKLMARLLAGSGLIFLDAISPELHRLAAPTLLHAVKEHKELAQELVSRSEALERAGFHAQVKVTAQSTLLFRMVGGQRLALRPANGGLVAGDKAEFFEDMLKAVEEHPEEFSPNALLRPVIQDTLLPTIAYIGGPAEIAYHAQTSVVYQRLLRRAPAILPRAGFTLVTSQVANLLKKYNLTAPEVLQEGHRLRARLEAEALPAALSSQFEQGEQAIRAALDGLRGPLGKLDQTLLGALETGTEKILYQFNGLRAKAGRAEGFRTGVLDTHENEIAGLILPDGALQERTFGLLSFLAAEGTELLENLAGQIKAGSGEHCFLYLRPAAK